MIAALKKLFGFTIVDLSELIRAGATIVDVRSPGEFDSGHVKGSINIPLEQILANIETLKSHKQIIVCCRSGNRSAHVQRVLESKGFRNVTNGGSWQNVNQNS